MELISAVRLNDLDRVQDLVKRDDVDVNEIVVVSGVGNHLYKSHALFEATVGGNTDVVNTLLQRDDIDVNQPAGDEEITVLADACRRRDLIMAELLLLDPRVDPYAGSANVRLPLQYAMFAGSLDLVKLFAKHGCLSFAEETLLLATAREADANDIHAWLEDFYLSKRSLSDLQPRDKVRKLWQVFCKYDLDGNNYIDKSELRIVAAALGTPLTEPELSEAQIALDTDGNGRIDFEELVAFWLADDTDRASFSSSDSDLIDDRPANNGKHQSKLSAGGISPEIVDAVNEILSESKVPQ